ncbi:hypothetical protein [Enterovibrio baiacu]|uniref:hypothetical protein n=1 Tax=Enterovibrio baiacu TaxID=2491023 RepID=UPI00101247C0|nr:hypothetical protein [Enterovibrio baiacu]MBE1275094.1 hypothetical protein [Enterovibrio baiacu]
MAQYTRQQIEAGLEKARAANDAEGIKDLEAALASLPQYSLSQLESARERAVAAGDQEAIADLDSSISRIQQSMPQQQEEGNYFTSGEPIKAAALAATKSASNFLHNWSKPVSDVIEGVSEAMDVPVPYLHVDYAKDYNPKTDYWFEKYDPRIGFDEPTQSLGVGIDKELSAAQGNLEEGLWTDAPELIAGVGTELALTRGVGLGDRLSRGSRVIQEAFRAGVGAASQEAHESGVISSEYAGDAALGATIAGGTQKLIDEGVEALTNRAIKKADADKAVAHRAATEAHYSKEVVEAQKVLDEVETKAKEAKTPEEKAKLEKLYFKTSGAGVSPKLRVDEDGVIVPQRDTMTPRKALSVVRVNELHKRLVQSGSTVDSQEFSRLLGTDTAMRELGFIPDKGETATNFIRSLGYDKTVDGMKGAARLTDVGIEQGLKASNAMLREFIAGADDPVVDIARSRFNALSEEILNGTDESAKRVIDELENKIIPSLRESSNFRLAIEMEDTLGIFNKFLDAKTVSASGKGAGLSSQQAVEEGYTKGTAAFTNKNMALIEPLATAFQWTATKAIDMLGGKVVASHIKRKQLSEAERFAESMKQTHTPRVRPEGEQIEYAGYASTANPQRERLIKPESDSRYTHEMSGTSESAIRLSPDEIPADKGERDAFFDALRNKGHDLFVVGDEVFLPRTPEGLAKNLYQTGYDKETGDILMTTDNVGHYDELGNKLGKTTKDKPSPVSHSNLKVRNPYTVQANPDGSLPEYDRKAAIEAGHDAIIIDRGAYDQKDPTKRRRQIRLIIDPSDPSSDVVIDSKITEALRNHPIGAAIASMLTQ